MSKKPASDQPLRYRVTVPLKDSDVINWMVEQSNPSVSIRMLIRAFIAKYGISDVTCLPVSAGLELDMQSPEFRQDIQQAVAPAKKTSVSLTEVRQGLVQPAQPVQPASQKAPEPVVQAPPAETQSKPAAPAPAPAPAPFPAAKPGYVPTDIHDLM